MMSFVPFLCQGADEISVSLRTTDKTVHVTISEVFNNIPY